MAEQKTKPTDVNVTEWLQQIEPEQKRRDSLALLELYQKVTGLKPVLWGNMIGFGSYHYKYESGHEGDCFITGFAPRKQNISLYMMPGFQRHTGLMERLGKHKSAKSCLYINKLADIDTTVLEQLIESSFREMQQMIEQKGRIC